MKRLFAPILLLIVTALSACNSDDSSSSSDDDPQPSRHTTIIYISGQNSLGYKNYTAMDSAEIARGAQRLTNTSDNILLYIDDASKPRIYRLSKSTNGRAYIQKVMQYSTDLNSSATSTLQGVMEFAKKNYPSQSYGLVLWSHGSNWVPDITSFDDETKRSGTDATLQSFGIDVGPDGDLSEDTNAQGLLGQQMEIDSIAVAIERSGVHLTYLFFDACMMQSIEVAYSLRNVTDYIIGSPATTSAYGIYYYDMIPGGLFAAPFTLDSIKKMVDTYYYDVNENPATKVLYPNQGCVMSVIKTSELENLAAATSSVLSKAISNRSSPDMSNVCNYVYYEYTAYPHAYDMGCAMKALLPDADYQTWRQQLDKAVPYKVGTSSFFYCYMFSRIYTRKLDEENFSAISMFVPQSIYTQNYQTEATYGDLNILFRDTQWYTAANWSQTGW